MSGRTPIVRELLGSTLFYFIRWPCGRLVLLDRMLLTETTVDAETAEPVDGAKMLVDGSCNLGIDLAAMVVKVADCAVCIHKGLDRLIKLSLENIDLLNCGSSVCHFAFESLNDFMRVAHGYSFPSGVFT